MVLGDGGTAVMPPLPVEEVARSPAAPAPAAASPAASAAPSPPRAPEGSLTTGLLHQAPASSRLGQLFAAAQDPETPLLRLGAGMNPAWSDAPSSSARPVIMEVTEEAGGAQVA